MRSLRGDNSAQSTGADLNATLTYMTMTNNMFPGQGPYLWDNRYNAIKELTIRSLLRSLFRKAQLLRISPCCSRFKSFSVRMQD